MDHNLMRVKQATCCDRKGFTYIMESFGMIKIGSALRIEKRFRTLRMGSAAPMALLAVSNGRDLERLLHKVCAAGRDHGEWFHLKEWDFIRPLFEQERCASCVILSRAPSTQEARDVIRRLVAIDAKPLELEPIKKHPRKRGTGIPKRRSRTRILIAGNGKRIVKPGRLDGK